MLPPMPRKPASSDNEPVEEPHYHGHRERVRERFFSAGPEALSDYASKLFGEPFGADSIVGETVETTEEFLKGRPVRPGPA